MSNILLAHTGTQTHTYTESTPRRDHDLYVPAVGRYMQLVPDFHPQLYAEFGGEPRTSSNRGEVPGTRDITDKDKTKPSAAVVMTEAWQRRHLELMDWNNYERSPNLEPERYFLAQRGEPLLHKPQNWCDKNTPGALPYYAEHSRLGMYQRAWADHVFGTDGRAWNTWGEGKEFQDFIMGTNKGFRPWEQKMLHMQNNIVRVIDRPYDATPEEINVSGSNYFITALNALESPPSLEWIFENMPECIVWGTTASPVMLPDGTYVVADLPYMQAWGVGFPFFFLAKKRYSMIKKIYVRSVTNGEKIQLYNPKIY